MNKINMAELLADRKDTEHPNSLVWQPAVDRRQARLPDLEAAYIEKVEQLRLAVEALKNLRRIVGHEVLEEIIDTTLEKIYEQDLPSDWATVI